MAHVHAMPSFGKALHMERVRYRLPARGAPFWFYASETPCMLTIACLCVLARPKKQESVHISGLWL